MRRAIGPLNSQYSTNINKIFKSVIQFKKLNQNIERCQDKISCKKEADLIHFGLTCSLVLNSYASNSFFKIELILKLHKIAGNEPFGHFQPFIYPNSFVWPCRQVINCIYTLFSWLHVFVTG